MGSGSINQDLLTFSQQLRYFSYRDTLPPRKPLLLQPPLLEYCTLPDKSGGVWNFCLFGGGVWSGKIYNIKSVHVDFPFVEITDFWHLLKIEKKKLGNIRRSISLCICRSIFSKNTSSGLYKVSTSSCPGVLMCPGILNDVRSFEDPHIVLYVIGQVWSSRCFECGALPYIALLGDRPLSLEYVPPLPHAKARLSVYKSIGNHFLLWSYGESKRVDSRCVGFFRAIFFHFSDFRAQNLELAVFRKKLNQNLFFAK